MSRKITDAEFRKRLLKPLDEMKNEEVSPSKGINKKSESNKLEGPSTLSKYASNPTGKGSAYVANRSAIKQGLNMTFIKLLREHRKVFVAMPYTYPNGDLLYWVKVPSEFYNDNKITYDVLFLIEYDKNVERKNRTMRVYSNSPSFIFTYAYVYNKHDLLIPQLKSKLPVQALTTPPEVRNPIQSFGYEKSTYIATMYLLDGKCLTDEYVNRYARNINSMNEPQVLSRVANPDTLLAIYQHAQYERRKTHRKEKTAQQNADAAKRKKEYIESQKKVIPKKGFIVQRSPRSKITARTAQRNLLNKKK